MTEIVSGPNRYALTVLRYEIPILSVTIASGVSHYGIGLGWAPTFDGLWVNGSGWRWGWGHYAHDCMRVDGDSSPLRKTLKPTGTQPLYGEAPEQPIYDEPVYVGVGWSWKMTGLASPSIPDADGADQEIYTGLVLTSSSLATKMPPQAWPFTNADLWGFNLVPVSFLLTPMLTGIIFRDAAGAVEQDTPGRRDAYLQILGVDQRRLRLYCLDPQGGASLEISNVKHLMKYGRKALLKIVGHGVEWFNGEVRVESVEEINPRAGHQRLMGSEYVSYVVTVKKVG